MEKWSAKEVESKLEKGMLNIVDVREVDEVKEGRIPDSVNIPLGLLEFRMHELDKNKEYVLVCRSGGRSGRACQLLESHGFKVVNMEGGMLAWEGRTE
ncbi:MULTISPECIES: rhodanese-like domain-containing protein [Bacillus]|uniref:Molybdopterin biosynthesis MoeB protein n=2 Tax=Bacillus infantis TaxID=324767 RepID=U5LHI8_9BACI|nr:MULTISPECIES: rhodanese-like domain-containing protein [Bacillus]OXT16988.1 rhodanese [Bacillus sp. OG2]AGX06131.1 molybdopterin biosynthesis MoeB protein [Bacillus infantis NRRL B-14911]EAR65628.1 rhodanese-like domain protein [Bacillus sp. NRRL B-14911]MCA1033831.1 rhodanese-like domain-containing protein [Bacillus infantis]MCK6207820.1 rhodanese-like domain-containing protein [Bacillus infantis]